MTGTARDVDGPDLLDPSLDPSMTEVERLRAELRLCREELAAVRRQNERVLAQQAKLKRTGTRAQREAAVLAKALVDVLYRETRARVRSRRWHRGAGDVSAEEWQQVQVLRQSGVFRPAWYLRRNLTVAKRAVDPALHFLREGAAEGRDPGPHFDLPAYVEDHPELASTGQNPLLHALEVGDLPAPRPGPTPPA